MSAAWVERPPVPSVEELMSIKGEIVMLERRIANEWSVIHQAQARLATLTKDLEEKRALVSPINKLNFDVLSIIFIFCSWVDPIAPLQIGSVSRYWRSVILRTPQAWCFIPSARIFQSHYETYLERSGQQPLHINLSDIIDGITSSTLTAVAHRIQCLSIPDLLLHSTYQTVFPRLTRLILSSDFEDESCADLLAVTTSKFPNLRHLDIHAMIDIFNICPELPPLQTLRISPHDEYGWPGVIKACITSLKSLELIIDAETLYGEVKGKFFPLDFPSLLFLKIVYRNRAWRSWWRRWNTPVLETFIEEVKECDFGNPVFKDGPESVATHTRLLRPPVLSEPRKFRVLQIALASLNVTHLLKILATNGSNCAQLQLLEFGLKTMPDTDKEEARRVLQAWDRKSLPASAHVVISEDRWSIELPGENELPVRGQLR